MKNTREIEGYVPVFQKTSYSIASAGGNIISVLHERNNNNSNVTACFLRLVMETRNAEHISLIRNALLEAGYTIVN